MKRSLAGWAALALLAVPLTACDSSPSGTDLGASGSASEEAASPTAAPAGNPALAAQAQQLAKSQPSFFAELTDSPSPSASPTEVSSTSADASSGPLDACTLVTKELFADDLGIELTAAPYPLESGFGDPNAQDCYWQDSHVLVAAAVTTRASTDIPPEDVSGYINSGTPGVETVPGADYGFAYVPDPNATDGAGFLVVVTGQRGAELQLTADQPISAEQIVKLGQDLVTALG